MQGGKRKSRYSNRCSSVTNPFYARGKKSGNIKYLPLEVVTAISSLPYLACDYISSFPTLTPGRNPDQMLMLMKKATEWQTGPFQRINSSGQQKYQSGKKVHNEMEAYQDIKQEFGTRSRLEGSIYEVLFQNDVQDFMMSPCPSLEANVSQQLKLPGLLQ